MGGKRGGFGLLPGSLANLIALRMANDRRIWWRFHLYSIPMLLWAALVGYVLLVMIPADKVWQIKKADYESAFVLRFDD